MELALRKYATAGFGAAVAGAGLIGIGPATSPPRDLHEFRVPWTNTAAGDGLVELSAIDPAAGTGDVFGAMQAVFDLGQTQFTAGFADFGAGDLVGGLDGVVSGATNFLVAAPATLVLGAADTLLGGTLLDDGVLPVLFYPPSPCDNFGDLVVDLQNQLQLVTDYLLDGIQQLSAGAVSEGLYSIAMSPIYLFVELPEHFLLDSVSLLLGGVAEA